MNIIQHRLIRSLVPLLIIACGCIFGFTSFAGEEGANSILAMNLSAIKSQADLILIGNLEVIGQPNEMIDKKTLYESLIRGKQFYKINAVEILKGNLPKKCLLFVRRNVDSSEGSPPSVEAQIPYMLFLHEVKLDDENLSKDLVCYKLVGNWKGIISLDGTASERRSIDRIAKQYGININERPEDFKEAIRYSLKEQGTKVPEKDLNSGAFAVYEGLKLTRATSQPPTNQTAVGTPQIPGAGKTHDLENAFTP